ncbi:hypothetical protein TNCT_236371 [Trichonephila clavata]|uniref:Uncharacterized protein n=1 Tax=Trichonephila clavata TaxID=2740835 RepID=A0A8X6KCV7_TRICU|nr:hypothetical protein TNCT_236371 [Trichonephila clavata]
MQKIDPIDRLAHIQTPPRFPSTTASSDSASHPMRTLLHFAPAIGQLTVTRLLFKYKMRNVRPLLRPAAIAVNRSSRRRLLLYSVCWANEERVSLL